MKMAALKFRVNGQYSILSREVKSKAFKKELANIERMEKMKRKGDV